MRLKRDLRIPWVADFRDPWATNGLLLGHLPKWVRRRHYRAERQMVEQADAVILAHPLAAEDMRHRYPAYAQKIHAITNGFDPDDYEPRSDSQQKRGNGRSITIVHTGSCYGQYGPQPLFKALEAFWKGPPPGIDEIRLRFIGGVGNVPPPHLKGVTFDITPRVSHAEAIRAQHDADLLLNVFDRTVGRLGISGKLFEYLASTRPILAIVPEDGTTAEIVRDCAAGWVADCDDGQEIVSVFNTAVQRVSRPDCALASCNNAIRKYSRLALSQQLAGVFHNVCSFGNSA